MEIQKLCIYTNKITKYTNFIKLNIKISHYVIHKILVQIYSIWLNTIIKLYLFTIEQMRKKKLLILMFFNVNKFTMIKFRFYIFINNKKFT